MSSFRDAMRRVATGDNAGGKSVVIIDGGPSSEVGSPELGGLFEIWQDAVSGSLDPRDNSDLGPSRPIVRPPDGKMQVRWFVVTPSPEGVPKSSLDEAVRARFAAYGGEHHVIDQSRHPAMHESHSTDIICLLQGDVSLILEDGETHLKPRQVVIQRGTNRAWQAHGGPALLLGVLITRELKRHC